METKEIEARFREKLEDRVDIKVAVYRDDHNVLCVSARSPCADIGQLVARVEATSITLSCNITQSHVDAAEMERRSYPEPVDAMLDEAVLKFVDLIESRAFLSKTTAPDGAVICSGWGPISAINDKNDKFEMMLAETYGSPIVEEKWLWSGKIDKSL
ncbi:hypothetical protein EB809_18715 [Marinobacter sp. R17]|uniref:hypothetical protein n=1 Tax=Marinobacter sp. R17 TaxID=2484250 RepID=UPI000F4D064D|nr:hypothetical protein [Marinobacter sp. R17]ROT95757.1 hypothetical protein EB809_18715 [Marinobacter sp. R17]